MKKNVLILTILSVAGIAAAARSTFAEVDGNKDGFITQEEFVNEAIAKGKKGNEGKFVKIFKKKDRDNDGKLTEAEFKWKPEKGTK